MLARDWVIVLVLFGFVAGTGYLIVEDVASSDSGYNVENMTDESYSRRYDTLTNSTQDILLMQNATASGEGMTVISVFTTMFQATFSVITIVFGSFGMATTTMTNFGQDLGMSSGMANLVFGSILVLIIATIVFIIISSISRGRL